MKLQMSKKEKLIFNIIIKIRYPIIGINAICRYIERLSCVLTIKGDVAHRMLM